MDNAAPMTLDIADAFVVTAIEHILQSEKLAAGEEKITRLKKHMRGIEKAVGNIYL